MEDRKDCKGCTASTRVSEKEIENMLNSIIFSGEFKLVEDNIYEQRLMQCKICKYLQYGNTCGQCGCIVHIRARLSEQNCPYPKSPKW